MSKTVRHIVRIDEEECDGCGACVPACTEGALQIVGGKARLVTEVYCDGLGACLGQCPRGAITIEERGAEEFDEDAAQRHAERSSRLRTPAAAQPVPCRPTVGPAASARPVSQAGPDVHQAPALSNFPIQLGLVSPASPFLHDADILLAADCAGYVYAGLWQLLRGRVLLIACPKLDDAEAHLEKLTAILKESMVKSITVVRTEVPCCSGLVRLAMAAVARSGRKVPVDVVVVGIDGKLKDV